MERAGRHRSTPLAQAVGGDHKRRGLKGPRGASGVMPADLARRRASLAGRFTFAIRSSVARRFTRVGLGDPEAGTGRANHEGPGPGSGVSPSVSTHQQPEAATALAAPLASAQQPTPDCPGPSDERSFRVALASRAGPVPPVTES